MKSESSRPPPTRNDNDNRPRFLRLAACQLCNCDLETPTYNVTCVGLGNNQNAIEELAFLLATSRLEIECSFSSSSQPVLMKAKLKAFHEYCGANKEKAIMQIDRAMLDDDLSRRQAPLKYFSFDST